MRGSIEDIFHIHHRALLWRKLTLLHSVGISADVAGEPIIKLIKLRFHMICLRDYTYAKRKSSGFKSVIRMVWFVFGRLCNALTSYYMCSVALLDDNNKA